ncbi:hypothetical protein QYM36_011766 [Artemia franciscana]|uniref:MACPF domain-containing protein n=1 Tax=Artemia franciscana TaxID=6661 RepID=A0AA88HQ83_ARTSF|nr:hypothetical protein QYM36_011766 [Artemia franciscana]
MSNSLITKGVRLGFHVEGKLMEEADKFLFDLNGDFELKPPRLHEVTKDKEYDNHLQMEYGLSHKFESKYSIDLEIDPQGVSGGVSPSYEASLQKSSGTKSSVANVQKLHYCFLPIGSFDLKIEQLQLTNEAKERLENLKFSEDALQFMKDFGSHFSTGFHHYGGITVKETSEEIREEIKRKTSADGSKISISAWIQIFKGGIVKSTEESSSVVKSETHKLYQKGVYQDFDENNVREYKDEITKNPEKAKIISRGPIEKLNGIWNFLQKEFPVQSDLLRLAWIQRTNSESDLIMARKIQLMNDIEKEKIQVRSIFRNKWRKNLEKKIQNEEHVLQQKMQDIQVKELDSNAEETPEKVQKHQKTEEGKSIRELRSYIHENIKKWYESEAMARAIVKIKTQQWQKVPTKHEYFHSLIDLLLVEIEEKDGIQAVFDIIKDFREIKERLMKRNIEIDSKYPFFDFIIEIFDLLDKSCDQGKELLSFDSFLSLLRRSFYSEEIAHDFELYSSEWQQKNIPFARSELEDIINMVSEIDNSSEIQDTINKKLWDSFINNKIWGKTILADLCEELCPLCKSPCLKEKHHKENHDCFHYPGGIVGHYYWKQKSLVGQKVSEFLHHGSKSIRTQDYVSILNDKEKFGQERFLSNYSCASAHEEYTFAFGTKNHHPFKNFSVVFRGWSSPTESRNGYHRYFINKYNNEISTRFNLNPCTFDGGEFKSTKILPEVKSDAFNTIEARLKKYFD